MKHIDVRSKAVLVTGCSSGIGRATAIYLAHAGFTVFASVRQAAGADALRQLEVPGLVPVCPLDLSRAEDIPPAVQFIGEELGRRGLGGLHGIVNNAGAGTTAPIELMDPDVLRTELEARVVGPIALLQGLVPLLRKGHGRIIWITTPGLMPIPYVASIHVPDFAVNCLARTLNLELQPWRIPSIMVRCGTIQTPAVDRTARELQEAMARWPSEGLALYGEALHEQQATLGKLDEKRTPPEEVARVVCEALSAERPKSRYRVGRLAGFAGAVELLPQSAVDQIMLRRG